MLSLRNIPGGDVIIIVNYIAIDYVQQGKPAMKLLKIP